MDKIDVVCSGIQMQKDKNYISYKFYQVNMDTKKAYLDGELSVGSNGDKQLFEVGKSYKLTIE